MIWPAESIWQQVIALGLPSLASFSVEILPEIDSTNSELMRRARAGRSEPTLLIAQQQTAGRGRMGRAWHSAAQDTLTFSLGLPLNPSSWHGLSLAVGASLAQSLDPSGAHGIQLKWPNDLWWHRRKLAGVLIEIAPMPHAPSDQARFAVIGIGINIRPRSFAAELNTPAACLNEITPASSPQSALEQLFAPLLNDVLTFERTGFAAFLARFAARDALAGLDVQLSDGRRGLAQGVDGSGALLVHTQQGVQRVASQEVSVRPQVFV